MLLRRPDYAPEDPVTTKLHNMRGDVSGGVVTLHGIQRSQVYRVYVELYDPRGFIAPSSPIASLTITGGRRLM